MTSCMEPNNSIVEKQPLHGNEEKQPLQDNCPQEEMSPVIPPNNDDTEHVVMSLLEHQDQEDDNTRVQIPSYAIEPAYQNTVENPYKETTITVPHLVRKVPQDDLTPKPWTTFNQVIILSYVSILFCMCIGAFANRWAWRAKIQNGKGLYGLAQKWSRKSAYVSYCAICVGILLMVFIPLSATGVI